jgi:hypothetical protein
MDEIPFLDVLILLPEVATPSGDRGCSPPPFHVLSYARLGGHRAASRRWHTTRGRPPPSASPPGMQPRLHGPPIRRHLLKVTNTPSLPFSIHLTLFLDFIRLTGTPLQKHGVGSDIL